jgi:hypothetical protein
VEGAVGVAVVVAVGTPVGVAVAVAVVVAVGVALRMSVGMVGVEVPARGRRGAGGADANLTKQARIDIASLGELWSFRSETLTNITSPSVR